jgi:hypothetical protein
LTAPLTDGWAGLVVSGNNLDSTTYGQGTSFPSSWNIGRLFWRTDENLLYKNTGTLSSPVWRRTGDIKFGDGSDGVKTVSSSEELTTGIKQYTTLTVNASQILTVPSTNHCTIILASESITINGTISVDGRGGSGGLGSSGGAGGTSAQAGYNGINFGVSNEAVTGSYSTTSASPQESAYDNTVGNYASYQDVESNTQFGTAGYGNEVSNGRGKGGGNGLPGAQGEDSGGTVGGSVAGLGANGADGVIVKDNFNTKDLEFLSTLYANTKCWGSGGSGGGGGGGGASGYGSITGTYFWMGGGAGGNGGNGGNGGGAIFLLAPTITFGASGKVTANGLAGSNGVNGIAGGTGGSNPNPDGGNGGGGGAGSGGNAGTIVYVYNTLSPSNADTTRSEVNGGVGGISGLKNNLSTAGDTANNGVAGDTGLVVKVSV